MSLEVRRPAYGCPVQPGGGFPLHHPYPVARRREPRGSGVEWMNVTY
jgi:hypothetical protein